MATGSAIDHLDDRQLVSSLREEDGAAEAVAQLYDTYAEGVYDYCHSLLRDDGAAAEAVHNSLIAAVQHVSRLREPERLRSWLYTLARAECVRLREEETDGSGVHRAAAVPEVEDKLLGEAELARKVAEEGPLAQGTAPGLTEGQREALDLTVRHNLSGEELAAVLGIRRPEAEALVEEARGRLDETVAAAVTVRDEDEECPSLGALIDEWPPSSEVCAKLVRHVENCASCGEHPLRLAVDQLLEVSAATEFPEELREHVLATATAPEHEDDRVVLGHRAEPLDPAGWPASEDRTNPPRPPSKAPSRLKPALAAAGVVVVVVGAIMLLTPDSPRAGNGADAGPSTPIDSATNVQPQQPGASAPPLEEKNASPTPTVTTPSITPTSSPSARRPGVPAPPPKPGPGGGGGGGGGGGAGSLSVGGCHMDWAKRSCTITVTARGGKVTWRVTGTSTDALSASGGGTLAAGRSASVTVSRDNVCLGTGSGSVYFSPSGSASITWQC